MIESIPFEPDPIVLNARPYSYATYKGRRVAIDKNQYPNLSEMDTSAVVFFRYLDPSALPIRIVQVEHSHNNVRKYHLITKGELSNID